MVLWVVLCIYTISRLWLVNERFYTRFYRRFTTRFYTRSTTRLTTRSTTRPYTTGYPWLSTQCHGRADSLVDSPY
ncbi:hypothetical protein EDC01DRAFT_682160 [Geopyxis carbonaria]|nr:hypothetical protein EDC01DRAFT_682160 [Geopyxis carbonaria]